MARINKDSLKILQGIYDLCKTEKGFPVGACHTVAEEIYRRIG